MKRKKAMQQFERGSQTTRSLGKQKVSFSFTEKKKRLLK